MCTSQRSRALMDNIIDVELDVVECSENLNEIVDRLGLEKILRCYDLDVIEETVGNLKDRGMLK